MATKAATSRDIVRNIAQEFSEGRHQQDIQHLPWEIQFRLGCSWGKALQHANDIRVGKIQPAGRCEDCGAVGHLECDRMAEDGMRTWQRVALEAALREIAARNEAR
jgi:hypothetical protein